MAKLAPAELPVSGGRGFGKLSHAAGGADARAQARSPSGLSHGGERVEDPAVFADADVALVVEHQPRHQRVGLLARQPRHAHDVGQADAPLARADDGEQAPLGLAGVLRGSRGTEEEAVHALVERQLGARVAPRRVPAGLVPPAPAPYPYPPP